MRIARSSSRHVVVSTPPHEQAQPREQAHPPGQIPLNFPHSCGPGSDPPKLPPWVWAWRLPGQTP